MSRHLPLLAVILASPVLAQVPETVDRAAIPNYRLVRPGLATAGQPTPEALAKLKEMGFKTVINLRTEKEGAMGEQQAVEAAGLRYVWVPVTPDTFSAADVATVARVLDDEAAAPVLLHCSSANRVGAVWAVIQAGKGKSAGEAEAEGRAVGLTSPAMVEAFRRVVAADKKP